MNEFFPSSEAEAVKLLLEEIFHSLYIMVGYRFMALDALCIGGGEIFVYGTQAFEQVLPGFGIICYIGQLRQRQGGKCNEIFHFHLYAVADEGEFRKIEVEAGCFSPVAAINWRDGGQLCQFHIRCGKI